ncbi:MAG: transporter substrate-binding domain-containing protein [Ardenticatenaceae bacterium]
MDLIDSSSDFFYTNGTVPLNNPSYVKRPADEELLKRVLQGHICYVLTTRQMGKSSLMGRTAERLEAQGLNVAKIDLTSMGAQSITIDQWYFGLLDRLQEELDLEVDPDAWWEKHPLLSCVQRFTNFIRDEVLKKKPGQVVIFIDEIDTSLHFDFRDDFFAAIRAMHNAGATQPLFERLTFVLLGTAWAPELIKDTTRTPFNVGEGIELKEFSLPQADVLQNGLERIYPAQGEAIFKRIYYWTSGHPYLTQRLCLTIAEKRNQNWGDEQIDALVEELFFSETAQKDSNIKFVQDRITQSPQRRQLLKLYKQVYQGQLIKDDPQSTIQNQLKLSGLVKAELPSQEAGTTANKRSPALRQAQEPPVEGFRLPFTSLWPNSEQEPASNGSLGAHKPMYLAVRNPIYRKLFDLEWVKENTQRDLGRIIAITTVIVAFFAIGLAGYVLWHDTVDLPDQAEKAELMFYQADTPQQRATSLTTLFELQGLVSPTDYDEKAQNLFYELERAEQLSLFKPYEVSESDLTIIVSGLYLTLADVDNTNRNQPLLSKMVYALEHAHTPETDNLKHEMTRWLEGREQFTNEEYREALAPYGTAIALNGDNPATFYERAQVYTALSNHGEAVTDLGQVIAIAKQAPTATPMPTPTNTPTASPAPTNTPTASPAPTNIPSSNVTLTATFTPSLPASTETATLSATVTPIGTATSTVTVVQAPFSSEFVSRNDRINAVQKLIDNNPALALFLAGASSVPSDLYTNFQEFGLVRTPTLTPLPTPIPGPTSTVVVVATERSTAARVLERGKIVAGYYPDAPPFSYEENGEPAGFDIEIVREFARRWLGDENAVEFIPVTVAGRLASIANGEVDLTASALTSERESDKLVDFSQTYFVDAQKLLVRQESGIHELEELEGKRVGAVEDTTSLAQIKRLAEEAGITIEIIDYPSHLQAVNALQKEQIDAVTSNSLILGDYAQTHPELKVVGRALSKQPLAVGLPTDDAQLLELVNFTLQEMKKDGTDERISQKWLPDETAYLIDTLPSDSDHLDDQQQLRVGVRIDLPPFGFLDDKGQESGFDVELIKAMAAEWGIKEEQIEFVPVTAGTALAKLAAGEVEILTTTPIDHQEEHKNIDFSETYFYDKQGLLVKNNSGIECITDLNGLTVAAIGQDDAARVQDHAEENDVKVEIVPFQEYKQALEALINGQVAALTANQTTLSHSANDHDNLNVADQFFSQAAYALGLPAHDSSFNQKVKKLFGNFKKESEYNRIYRRWFGLNLDPVDQTLYDQSLYIAE